MNKTLHEACPTDETFVRAFMNESSLKEKENLVTHVMTCTHCWMRYQVLRQLRTDLKGLEAVPEKAVFSWRLGRKLIAVVGSAVILLAAGIFLLKFEKSAAYRGNGGGRLVLLEPAQTLKRPPSVFKWTPVKGADDYIFKLIDEELNILLRTGGKYTELALSADKASKLVWGKTYVWTIEAYDDESRILDRSSKSFELR